MILRPTQRKKKEDGHKKRTEIEDTKRRRERGQTHRKKTDGHKKGTETEDPEWH